MFSNFFKIALRHLMKQKMYSAIKICGFAIGIAACLLIALFIREELSYDRGYPDASRIYRIIGAINENGNIRRGTSMPAPMRTALKNNFPEVEAAGRIMPNRLFDGAGSNYVRLADKTNNSFEEGFTYADQDMLDILKIPMVYGDRKQALAAPNAIVISKKKSDKFFPGVNPVGKIIYLNDNKEKPYTIGGVMQDFPVNSHLQFDYLLTLTGVEFWPGEQNTWMASNYDNYVLVRPGTDIPALEKKITYSILNDYVIPVMKQAGNKDAESIAKSGSIHLQPITDIYLRSYNIDSDDVKSTGDIRLIWLFAAIAAFILIIACINFINLSTAKSANRAKEVGLRKVVGSLKGSLIKQFLVESMVFSFLSFAGGLILAAILLPYFNGIAGRSLSIPWNEWWLLPLMIAAAVVIGLLAGLYPSFYLSSFKPIQVLKGQVAKGSRHSGFRNALVVFQFTTSIILIISTIVIYNQMQFILNQKLGFDKEQVVLINGAHTLGNNVRNFKNELLDLPEVKHVSVSDYLPVASTKRNGNQFWNAGKQIVEAPANGQFWLVDNDYLQTIGIRLVAGRNFSADIVSDSQRVIINQTLARELNLKDPVGKQIANGNGTWEVIGVVEDFHFESLRQKVEGLCLQLGNSPSVVSVKISGGDMRKSIASITALWQSFAPGQPIRFDFLDERIKLMYADVERMGKIFTSFTILTIIVACLGLFALSAFMAEQRSKEIGIRKVLGASITGITALLSKDFLKLIAIAMIIASPIAWWAMSKWLEDFNYRTSIGWWIFIVAGVISLLIALITISFQSLKAATANPVKTLRSE
jgi:putative ABC transport system permease protein